VPILSFSMSGSSHIPSSALACEAEKVTRITRIANSFLILYRVIDFCEEPKILKSVFRKIDFNIFIRKGFPG
jgi:hypothetical protein